MPNKRDCEICDELNTCIEKGTLCPECHKTGFYYRKKTDDYRCPHCKNVWSTGDGMTDQEPGTGTEETTISDSNDIPMNRDPPCIIITIFPDESWEMEHFRNTPGVIYAACRANMENNFNDELEYFKNCEPIPEIPTNKKKSIKEESGMAGLGALFG
jgi:ribosomal protein L37AE/L43A